jgi:hypothetical protein
MRTIAPARSQRGENDHVAATVGPPFLHRKEGGAGEHAQHNPLSPAGQARLDLGPIGKETVGDYRGSRGSDDQHGPGHDEGGTTDMTAESINVPGTDAATRGTERVARRPEPHAGPEPVTYMEEIKRTSSPRTSDGTRWEVQLSGIPSREWLDLFRASREVATTAMARRVEFDRACAVFKSDEDHVPHWIEWIDRWIASTNARRLMDLEQVRRDLSDRLDAETKEKERIRGLNERFKDL